jgi:hypothetical protein
MKFVITFLFCVAAFVCQAQTSKELIGKWKLVKQTKDGAVTTPTDVYQVFQDGGVFQGINGSSSRKGKWKLSDDNKTLTVKISIISIAFTVDYFDSKKRTISNDKTGTLEYQKVE